MQILYAKGDSFLSAEWYRYILWKILKSNRLPMDFYVPAISDLHVIKTFMTHIRVYSWVSSGFKSHFFIKFFEIQVSSLWKWTTKLYKETVHIFGKLRGNPKRETSTLEYIIAGVINPIFLTKFVALFLSFQRALGRLWSEPWKTKVHPLLRLRVTVKKMTYEYWSHSSI